MWGQSYLDVVRAHGATPLTVRYTTGSGHRRLRRRARRPARSARGRLAGGRRADRAGRPLDGGAGHPRGPRRRPVAGASGSPTSSPWAPRTRERPWSGPLSEGWRWPRRCRSRLRWLPWATSAAPGSRTSGSPTSPPPRPVPDWHLVAASLRPRDAVGLVGRARSGLLGPLGDGLVSVGAPSPSRSTSPRGAWSSTTPATWPCWTIPRRPTSCGRSWRPRESPPLTPPAVGHHVPMDLAALRTCAARHPPALAGLRRGVRRRHARVGPRGT